MGKCKKTRSSNIGGQAVLEGVMMKHKDRYAVAVRKTDGEIEVRVRDYKGVLAGSPLKRMPFVRGVFNFADSMILGMESLSYSAAFFEEEEDAGNNSGQNTPRELNEKTPKEDGSGEVDGGAKGTQDKEVKAEKKEKTPAKEEKKGDGVVIGATMVVSLLLSIAIFMVLPYFIAQFLSDRIANPNLLSLIEGLVRLSIFLLYVILVSLLKDIRRLYQYHGAEHKCINCLETGNPMTVENVLKASRLHKRCGTSFLLFVMIISVILFFFIRVDHPALRVLVRVAFIPVIAGISYEIIKLAGNSDFFLIRLLSVPGLCLQKITTGEPDRDMVEVAIASVEAVFDWRAYLEENFTDHEEWIDSVQDKDKAENNDMELLDLSE